MTVLRLGLVLIVSVAVLQACTATKTVNRAPVEDRGTPVPAVQSNAAASAVAKPVLPGAENAGKPGYYTVKPGDTVIRIALDNGQNWRDLVRWNALENPNLIEVGQVLRVAPPNSETLAVTRPVPTPVAAAQTLPASNAASLNVATPTAVSPPPHLQRPQMMTWAGYGLPAAAC